MQRSHPLSQKPNGEYERLRTVAEQWIVARRLSWSGSCPPSGRPARGSAQVTRVVCSVVNPVWPSSQTGYLFRAPLDDAGVGDYAHPGEHHRALFRPGQMLFLPAPGSPAVKAATVNLTFVHIGG